MNKLQKESIAHHKRMQDWVKTQPLKYPPSFDSMLAAIDEGWYGDHCFYCNDLEHRRDQQPTENFCKLADDHDNNCDDGENCCGGLWKRLSRSQTWSAWLDVDKKIVEYIKKHG
jgi:hypothetical protein